MYKRYLYCSSGAVCSVPGTRYALCTRSAQFFFTRLKIPPSNCLVPFCVCRRLCTWSAQFYTSLKIPLSNCLVPFFVYRRLCTWSAQFLTRASESPPNYYVASFSCIAGYDMHLISATLHEPQNPPPRRLLVFCFIFVYRRICAMYLISTTLQEPQILPPKYFASFWRVADGCMHLIHATFGRASKSPPDCFVSFLCITDDAPDQHNFTRASKSPPPSIADTAVHLISTRSITPASKPRRTLFSSAFRIRRYHALDQHYFLGNRSPKNDLLSFFRSFFHVTEAAPDSITGEHSNQDLRSA